MKLSELKKTQWFRWFVAVATITSLALLLYFLVTRFAVAVATVIVITGIGGLAWLLKTELLDKIW